MIMEIVGDVNIMSIAVTLITVLGSTAAWDYYKKRLELRRAEEDKNVEEKNLYRDDLKERVAKLEQLLELASKEKDKLHNIVIQLTSEVAALTTKVIFLEKEISKLEAENRLLKG
jgi:chromosome segregation ATPase